MMFISDMCLYMYILYMCIQCYMYIQYPQWLLHIWYILSFLICLLVAFARETVAKLVPRLVRSDGVQQPLIDSLFARVNQVNI